MGTRIGTKTAYQAIPDFTRGLKIYGINHIDKLDELLHAMRTWNLHGSANKLENWKADIEAYAHYEWFEADPEGIWDWDDMDEEFRKLRAM